LNRESTIPSDKEKKITAKSALSNQILTLTMNTLKKEIETFMMVFLRASEDLSRDFKLENKFVSIGRINLPMSLMVKIMKKIKTKSSILPHS